MVAFAWDEVNEFYKFVWFVKQLYKDEFTEFKEEAQEEFYDVH